MLAIERLSLFEGPLCDVQPLHEQLSSMWLIGGSWSKNCAAHRHFVLASISARQLPRRGASQSLRDGNPLSGLAENLPSTGSAGISSLNRQKPHLFGEK
jgi:hypothetical protein